MNHDSMKPMANPTAMSAVLGEEIELGSRPGDAGALLKDLIMPALLVAFATYLLFGILAMEVPEGTTFPGPAFFPGLITAALYLFAILLVIGALREHRAAGRAGTLVSGDPVVVSDGAGAAGLDEPHDPAVEIVSVDGVENAGGVDAASSAKRVGVDWKSLAWIVLPFLAFALTLQFLGWVIGAALLFVCVARGFGEKRVLLSAVTGLTVSSFAYIAFDMALGMQLPSGILGGGF